MRSTTPQGQDPDDVRRGPETAHLRELWHDRVDVIPAPGESAERAVADGGPEQAIQALTDLDQSHLGRQGVSSGDPVRRRRTSSRRQTGESEEVVGVTSSRKSSRWTWS
jgi:hypothetical protein